MTVRRYLFLLTLITILAWALWWLVITFIDPSTGAFWSIILFYLTLFFSLMGTFTLFGYLLRKISSKNEFGRDRINIALRQGVLFSILVNFSLFLKSHDKLNIITVLVLIVILSLIEYLMLSIKSKRINE